MLQNHNGNWYYPYSYWLSNIPYQHPVYTTQPWVFPVADNTLRAELNELRERVARLEKR